MNIIEKHYLFESNEIICDIISNVKPGDRVKVIVKSTKNQNKKLRVIFNHSYTYSHLGNIKSFKNSKDDKEIHFVIHNSKFEIKLHGNVSWINKWWSNVFIESKYKIIIKGT